MSLPASDGFTGTSGTALQTYSANWTIVAGAFVLNNAFGNGVRQNASGANCLAFWNADTFGPDQYSQVAVITNITGGVYMGCAVRIQSGSATCYSLTYDNGGLYINKWNSGTATQLGTTMASPSGGDIIKIGVVGSSITAYSNGTPLQTVTDSLITSGQAGLSGVGINGPIVGSWQANNITSVAYLARSLSRTSPGIRGP